MQSVAIKQALIAYAAQLAKQVERSIKEGFSAAIVSMFHGALWIAGLGLLVTLFIPVVPLCDRGSTPNDKEPA